MKKRSAPIERITTAPASPAVEDGRVIVSFGSAGLFCYDLDGNELWKRDFGAIDHVWGNSTSPVLIDDLVIHYHGPAKKRRSLWARQKYW